MKGIETYSAKAGPPGGSANPTETDLADLQRFSLLVKHYQEEHYPMSFELIAIKF